MEGKKKHGGKRENSGRLKKDEVISLIETLDAIAVPNEVWKKLYSNVKDGDINAIKLWLQYRYGMPKQIIEQTNITPVTEIVLVDAISDTNT